MPNVKYSDEVIESQYTYQKVVVEGSVLTPVSTQLVFRTERRVPKVGMLLVGLGGNNGTTITAGLLANKHRISWHTKEGLQQPNYFGSLTQASTVQIGVSASGEPVYVPFSSLLPMVDPSSLVIGGWDISGMNLADAMERACVIDYDLQRQLKPLMEGIVPLPGVYFPDFIAGNQADRADHILRGSKAEQLKQLRKDIQKFKADNALDKVIVLWTATTERYCEIIPGVNDTADNLLRAVESGHSEVSPSLLYAIAAVLEGCAYINGSPQNTLVPGLQQLAGQQPSKGVFLVGDDFKSGQTKLKSVLVDFLVSAGIKPISIASYNHLGNNDGRNLSAPEQFRSKEISKSNVVDDMVASNDILYKTGKDHPDHVVVIKYVPAVGDSKRAMDEYTSEIFLNGRNTLVIHNTCEDSLLAAPLILDLVLLTELAQRITIAEAAPNQSREELKFEHFHPILSLLSYLMKAPVVPEGAPVVNALAAQRQCIVNVLRACIGLPPENYMALEHRLPALIASHRGTKRALEDEGSYHYGNGHVRTNGHAQNGHGN